MKAPFDAAKPRSKTKSPSMSLEQALFEEEQEVLKLIGAKQDTLPPPPLPIGSSRHGSISMLNSKTSRSSSHVGTRRDLEGLLSPQAYQFGVATGPLNRASDFSGSRRKSTPDHHRRSSSPVPRPPTLKPHAPASPPPVLPSFEKAYRRLSNAAMAQSGGSLGRLASMSSPRSSLSQQTAEVRLEKDTDPDSVIESSSSSEDESDPTSNAQSPSLKPINSARGFQDELGYEQQQYRTPLSLSAAADQERIPNSLAELTSRPPSRGPHCTIVRSRTPSPLCHPPPKTPPNGP